MDWIANPETWIVLVTLTVMEIVLGIDNIIFISLITGRLPRSEQPKARLTGLSLAMLMRLLLLACISWVMSLNRPFLTLAGHGFSGRDLILLGGGLFLIAKSTHEIHDRLEGAEETEASAKKTSFGGMILQIVLLDIVFSLDSVITAVGMANDLPVMFAAVIIAVGFMLVFSGAVSDFVHRHPTVKMLALSFLLLIGVTLVADGCGQHISKGYIYFAMAFSVFVEILNLNVHRTEQPPVKLRVPEI